MNNPLSNQQKGDIAKLARQAYDAWEQRDEFELANPTLSRTACFEAWRHVEQGKAVGVQSLRLCTSEKHYLRLMAHFAKLLGESARALLLLLRHGEEPRIRAYFKLRQALAERGLAEDYAAAICRRQYKRPLGEASEKQLWNLFYTVRNRRKPLPKAPRAPRKIKATGGVLTADQPF